MGKVYYNKLVRDHIETKILSRGEQCDVRELNDAAEFEKELAKKIVEEAHELAHARTRADFLHEYADLMVALDALTAHMEVSPAELSLAMQENIEAKGLYKKRHYLRWADDAEFERNETPPSVR